MAHEFIVQWMASFNPWPITVWGPPGLDDSLKLSGLKVQKFFPNDDFDPARIPFQNKTYRSIALIDVFVKRLPAFKWKDDFEKIGSLVDDRGHIFVTGRYEPNKESWKDETVSPPEAVLDLTNWAKKIVDVRGFSLADAATFCRATEQDLEPCSPSEASRILIPMVKIDAEKMRIDSWAKK